MAYKKRSKRSAGSSKRSTSSPRRRVRRAGGARKSSPQVVTIRIEQAQPSMPFPTGQLPEGIGNVMALTTPRRNRF